jgi:hypothetical protein
MRYVLVRVVVVVLFVATFAAALVVVMHALHTDALHVLDRWQEWWERLFELSQLCSLHAAIMMRRRTTATAPFTSASVI